MFSLLRQGAFIVCSCQAVKLRTTIGPYHTDGPKKPYHHSFGGGGTSVRPSHFAGPLLIPPARSPAQPGHAPAVSKLGAAPAASAQEAEAPGPAARDSGVGRGSAGPAPAATTTPMPLLVTDLAVTVTVAVVWLWLW